MKLTVYPRSKDGKGHVRRLRYANEIPGVVYGSKKKSEAIFMKGADFHAILRAVPPNQLSTTMIDLQLHSETYKVIVKDVQYHRTTYDIQHIDFAIVVKDTPVVVLVPIRCDGAAECAGVKLGGMLRQVIRSIKVECLPKDIPAVFAFDVKNMGIADSKRLSELSIPAGVKPIAKMDEVFVTVAKR